MPRRWGEFFWLVRIIFQHLLLHCWFYCSWGKKKIARINVLKDLGYQSWLNWLIENYFAPFRRSWVQFSQSLVLYDIEIVFNLVCLLALLNLSLLIIGPTKYLEIQILEFLSKTLKGLYSLPFPLKPSFVFVCGAAK